MCVCVCVCVCVYVCVCVEVSLPKGGLGRTRSRARSRSLLIVQNVCCARESAFLVPLFLFPCRTDRLEHRHQSHAAHTHAHTHICSLLLCVNPHI